MKKWGKMKKIILILGILISSFIYAEGSLNILKNGSLDATKPLEIGDFNLADDGKTKRETPAVRYKLAGKILNEYNVKLDLKDIEKKVLISIKDPVKQGKVLKVVREAYSYLGTKYRWGGNTKNGIDCSGIVHNALLKGGVTTRRVSRLQAKDSKPIKVKDATIGDLVFFKTTDADEITHVGLYLGDGLFLHASSGYEKVVITKLKGFYKKTFSGFGRFI